MIYAFFNNEAELITLTSRKKAIKYVQNNFLEGKEIIKTDRIHNNSCIRISTEDNFHDIFMSEPNSIEDVPPIRDEQGNFGITEKYAMLIMHSDVKAFEIVNIISDRTIEVRRLKAIRNFKPEFEVGGFSANCKNNDEQEWKFESNEENPLIRLRKAKNDDLWLHKGDRFRLGNEPYEKYDYNF